MRSIPLLWILALFAVAPVAPLGCGSAGDAAITVPPAPTAGPDGAAPPAAPIWTTCPTGFVSECTTLQPPLDHAHPEGGHIELLVAHQPANQPVAARRAGEVGPAIWLLEGGPGGSGADFVDILPRLAALNPALEIYTLDHRGVGHSSALACPEQEAAASPGGAEIQDAEWDACIARLREVPGLEHYNVTQAAHDLSFAIGKTRKPGQPVFVYGVSYGTYWLNRYLQLHPDEPTAAIMDSIMDPRLWIEPGSDLQADTVARQWFDRCGQDAFCAGKLGSDPWATLASVYTRLRAGHCPALGMTTKLLRQTLTSLFDDRDARTLLLALVHRIDRCTTADVDAISRFYTRMFGQGGGLSNYSVALENHIVLSELWKGSTPPAEQKAAVEATFLSSDYAPSATALYPRWPRYVPDATAHLWHASTRPVLLLAGTLDIRTLYSTMGGTKGHGTLVTFPGEGHGIIVQSRVTDPRQPSCGLTVIDAFVKSGGTVVDASCVNDLAPPSFTFPAAVAEDIFGRPDIWD